MKRSSAAPWSPFTRSLLDRVTGGDVIAEIETDKATIDFSHQDDGFLAKIIQPAGSEDIHVGTVLALMVEDAKDIAEVQASAAPAKAPSPAAPAVSPPAAPVAPAPSTSPAAAPAAPLAQHEALPSARILMANLGVDPAALRNRGTGKAGRITKGDVQAFVSGTGSIAAGAPAVHAASPVAHAAAAAAAPAAPAAPSAPAPASALAADFGRYTDSKPSNVRKVIASRLTESKARIPHEYAVMDCRIDALLKLRAQVRGAREQGHCTCVRAYLPLRLLTRAAQGRGGRRQRQRHGRQGGRQGDGGRARGQPLLRRQGRRGAGGVGGGR